MNNDFVVNVNELVRKDYVKTMGNSVMGNLRKAVRLLFTSYMLFISGGSLFHLCWCLLLHFSPSLFSVSSFSFATILKSKLDLEAFGLRCLMTYFLYSLLLFVKTRSKFLALCTLKIFLKCVTAP